MAVKITSRDFKRARPGGLKFDVGRWREFAVGLAVGLSLSLFVLIWQNYREKHVATEVAATPKPEPRADKAAAGDAEEGAKNYDFYDMLPKFEVVVPEKERAVRADLPAAAVSSPGVYVLQAGSYRNQPEADRMRSMLAKQGIEATVQRVQVDTDVWHRVRIGPIRDLKQLNDTRAALRKADIDVIVVRIGD